MFLVLSGCSIYLQVYVADDIKSVPKISEMPSINRGTCIQQFNAVYKSIAHKNQHKTAIQKPFTKVSSKVAPPSIPSSSTGRSPGSSPPRSSQPTSGRPPRKPSREKPPPSDERPAESGEPERAAAVRGAREGVQMERVASVNPDLEVPGVVPRHFDVDGVFHIISLNLEVSICFGAS